MSIELKEVVSFGSLLVSGIALFFSVQARQEAQRLDELVFRAETVNRLLKEVHDNTTKANDEQDRTASCLYAGALAKAEEELVPNEDQRLVGKLFRDQVDRGLLPQNCVVGTLEVLQVSVEARAPANAQTEVSSGSKSFKIGRYHALIASYPAIPSQCRYASDDVVEFSSLLEGMGFQGRSVYVARTVKSNSFAVTVDAGDDKSLAQNIRSAIQSVAIRSSDGRTGHDSFVQASTDWYIDPDCDVAAMIKS